MLSAHTARFFEGDTMEAIMEGTPKTHYNTLAECVSRPVARRYTLIVDTEVIVSWALITFLKQVLA